MLMIESTESNTVDIGQTLFKPRSSLENHANNH
jgi:hypothetical protein